MEMNLKNVLDDLIAFAKTLPAFTGTPKNVKEYEGEYDDDDWTERHPSLFIEISGMAPVSVDAERNLMTRRVEFLILIGGRTNSQKHPLEITSEAAEGFESQEFVYDEVSYYCHLRGINFFGRKKQVKIYALRFELSS